jgi:quinolinate synthase
MLFFMGANMNIINEIKKLKEEKDALILAHYYQLSEVQDIADYVGDSLELSKLAKETNKKLIVLCGVHFMAETAKILAYDKKVLLPTNAGCPMADTLNYDKLKEYKDNNPNTVIVGYVNTTAKCKTLFDVCVTSSNALKIIKHFKGKKILYVPDKNLGSYANYLDNLNMKLWNGFCYIHNNLKVQDVIQKKKLYPDALVLIHPEAPLEILKMADFVGSTKEILEFSKQSNAKNFIIGTEKGIIHQLKKASPQKNFILLTEELVCNSMKLTTLEDVKNALIKEEIEIKIDFETRSKALKALEKMFELS